MNDSDHVVAMETVSEEVLPCPFCAAIIKRSLEGFWVHSEPKCLLSGYTFRDDALAAWNRRAASELLASRLAKQAPAWQGIDSAPFSGPLVGHWSTDEGAEMANRYSAKSRDQLAYGQKTDLELANAVFMADRGSLELIGLQTAAKERIRWLSVQMALLKRAVPASPSPVGGSVS